jgi:hypothetical protein
MEYMTRHLPELGIGRHEASKIARRVAWSREFDEFKHDVCNKTAQNEGCGGSCAEIDIGKHFQSVADEGGIRIQGDYLCC